MIVRSAPGLAPAEAARRVALGADPVWISSPGDAQSTGGDDHAEVAVGFDAVATDPVTVVRGQSLVAVEQAWHAARQAWSDTGTTPDGEIPAAVGWLSYDLARQWIALASRVGDAASAGGDERANDPSDACDASDAGWPLLEFRFFDALWMRRVGEPEARIMACTAAAAERLAARLERPAPTLSPPRLAKLRAPQGTDPARAHATAVGKIKDYLVAGDAYQVNLARRLLAEISDGDPVWMAAALRDRSPAPHAVWLGARSRPGGPIDRAIVGNSPERFLHLGRDRVVETRPIKGTRPRGADAPADEAARLSLLSSAKDRAEHVMIVDMERNDLGRVCETGSVTVHGLLRLVKLPTVYHLVSTVRGRLRPAVGLPELIEATFPGGSITGAPKRRAMEIIDELEPTRRGVYSGATGWLGAAGDLDLAIAIRTATVTCGRVSLSVGGGIVVDSDAASEWEETEVKARAFMNLGHQAP